MIDLIAGQWRIVNSSTIAHKSLNVDVASEKLVNDSFPRLLPNDITLIVGKRSTGSYLGSYLFGRHTAVFVKYGDFRMLASRRTKLSLRTPATDRTVPI